MYCHSVTWGWSKLCLKHIHISELFSCKTLSLWWVNPQDQSLHTYKTKHTYTNIKLLELVPSLLPLLKKNVGLGHAAIKDGKCVCIVTHGHTHTFSLSHGFTEQRWQNECINYIPSSLFPQGTQNPDSERCGTACAFTQKSCISDAKVWVD